MSMIFAEIVDANFHICVKFPIVTFSAVAPFVWQWAHMFALKIFSADKFIDRYFKIIGNFP